jgi:CheY-like chemotaxis protein
MDTTTSIMIVDDDTDDIEIFCDAVHEINTNIDCVAAPNGIEALKILKSMPVLPDFIFLDLNMPKMGGTQCLSIIKNTDHLQDIPIVIYSTSKIKDDMDETMKLGATCFLTKPSTFSALKKAIGNVLQKKWNSINDYFH